MIIADLTSIVRYRNVPSYASLGASGAISGVMVSAVMLTPTLGNEIYIWGIPGWLFVLIYIIGSYFYSKRSMTNVAHEAHLWGALGGAMLTFAMYPKAGIKFFESVWESVTGFF